MYKDMEQREFHESSDCNSGGEKGRILKGMYSI